tara:strand:- start:407 stop:637 length:231 start_codon:yes stop_codon:yes gene_type:complete
MGLNIAKGSENFSLCTVGRPYLTRAEGERLWGPCPKVIFHEDVERGLDEVLSQEVSGRYMNTFGKIYESIRSLWKS